MFKYKRTALRKAEYTLSVRKERNCPAKKKEKIFYLTNIKGCDIIYWNGEFLMETYQTCRKCGLPLKAGHRIIGVCNYCSLEPPKVIKIKKIKYGNISKSKG